MKIGPDAARYLAAGDGHRVSRPFHLRWSLPFLCGSNVRAWWVVWLASWPVMAAAMVAWRIVVGDGWRVAVAAAVVLAGLPGIVGPQVVVPVGVDLPATATTLVGVWLMSMGQPGQVAAGVVVVALAATMKESAPVFAALWAWSLWPLVALVVVAVRWLIVKPGPDPLGPRFQAIADHPVREAGAAHRGRWRDGWLMVAPWGVGLIALHSLSVQLVVTVAVAYALLLVATDTVRIVQHAAGPVVAAAACAQVPVGWLPVVCVFGVVWFWQVERV